MRRLQAESGCEDERGLERARLSARELQEETQLELEKKKKKGRGTEGPGAPLRGSLAEPFGLRNAV